MNRLVYLLPLLLVLGLGVLFVVQMEKPSEAGRLPSPLIGKMAPMLELKGLEPSPGFGPKDLADGQVKIINFWASWCTPCRAEHSLFARLKGRVALWSINYKDKSENALGFLDELNDPFEKIGVDFDGRAAIEWGVYGVPETFVLDGKGTIITRFAGPITTSVLEKTIRPAIAQAAAN